MKYKHLLFDADNTLLDFTRSEEVAFYSALEDLHIEKKNGMLEAYSRINDGCWKMLERGEITKKELLKRRYQLFLEEYHLEKDPLSLNEAYVEHLSKASFLLEGALPLIQKLHEKADVYIITNGIEKVQRGRFALSPLTPYIKGLFISECMGTKKPEKLFFDRVAEQIPDYKKENAIVVGDSLTSDIRGAENSGIDSLWYNPHFLENKEHVNVTYEAHSFLEIEKILLGE